MAVTVIPQTEGGFLAHRSLLIRAYPKNLSDTHLPWLLSACADPGARVSAEFFFSNDTEDHQLATLLILRAEGPQRREVEARLDRTSRMILTNLRKAGYTAELMDDHPASTRELLSPFVFFFLLPAKGGDAVTGYYLPDQPPLPEKRQPYLPAPASPAAHAVRSVHLCPQRHLPSVPPYPHDQRRMRGAGAPDLFC